MHILNQPWIGIGISAISTIVLFVQWRLPVALYGVRVLHCSFDYVRMRLKSVESPNRLWYLIAPIITVIAALIVSEYERPHAAVFFGVFLLSLSVASTEAAPPVILFLGSSNDKSFRLNYFLISEFVPNKVVSFLEPKTLTIFTKTVYTEFSLRTESEEAWRSAVHTMIRMTPLIVIDLRFVTPYIAEECELLLAEQIIDKTVFVTETGAIAELLDSASGAQRQKVCIRDAHNAVLEVKQRMGRLLKG